MIFVMLNFIVWKKYFFLLFDFFFIENGRVWENYLDFVNFLYYNSLIKNNKYDKIIKIKVFFYEYLFICKLLFIWLNKNVYYGERVCFK